MKIGYYPSLTIPTTLQKEEKDHNNSDFEYFPIDSSIDPIVDIDLLKLSELLKNGTFEAIVLPLHLISPPIQPDSICITALTERTVPDQSLIYNTNKNGANSLLPKGARIGTVKKIHLKMVSYFYEHCSSHFYESEKKILKALQMNDIDAAILPCGTQHSFQEQVVGPMEFVPEPGEGVSAYLTLKDYLPIRRKLKPIHHTNTAKCTNVERSILLGAIDAELPKPQVYCEINQAGHFQVWVFSEAMNSGDPLYFRHSSSTSADLAAIILEKLQQ